MKRILMPVLPAIKWFPLIALAILFTCSHQSYAQSTIRPDTKTVQIAVHGVSADDRATITGLYTVSSGEINLPKLGKVKISDWGYATLSLAIQKAYRDSGGLPNIEVDAWFFDGCCSGASQCIDISGDLWVGRLSIPIRFGKMKLSEALEDMRPKESANLAEIEILRDGKHLIVDATTKEGLGTELKNHDVITVPSKVQPSLPPNNQK